MYRMKKSGHLWRAQTKLRMMERDKMMTRLDIFTMSRYFSLLIDWNTLYRYCFIFLQEKFYQMNITLITISLCDSDQLLYIIGKNARFFSHFSVFVDKVQEKSSLFESWLRFFLKLELLSYSVTFYWLRVRKTALQSHLKSILSAEKYNSHNFIIKDWLKWKKRR